MRLHRARGHDHFLFARPWLDGPTALAGVVERTGSMDLMTTVSLVALRGPVQLAKTLQALDVLSQGRMIAGVGPGSSARDYAAVGVPFDERWARFDEATAVLRSLLRGEPPPAALRFHAQPDGPLAPASPRSGGVPVGSAAGARRRACGASPGSVTDGSRPRTTRPPRPSRAPASPCPASSASDPAASRTRW